MHKRTKVLVPDHPACAGEPPLDEQGVDVGDGEG